MAYVADPSPAEHETLCEIGEDVIRSIHGRDRSLAANAMLRVAFAIFSLGGASESQVRSVIEACFKSFPMQKPN